MRFTSTTWRQSSSGLVLGRRPRPPMPALFTSTSMREPAALDQALAVGVDGDVAGHRHHAVAELGGEGLEAVDAGGRRPRRWRRPPCSTRVKRSPRPEDAPVTTATWPSRENIEAVASMGADSGRQPA